MASNGRALILMPKGAAARANLIRDEAVLWAKVTATIRPLSREPIAEPAAKSAAAPP